ncbi:MAG: SUMF1/EgtB/PvdO family nonheme iron enzyme [Candidatus Fermentibacteraceae bacterium]
MKKRCSVFLSVLAAAFAFVIACGGGNSGESHASAASVTPEDTLFQLIHGGTFVNSSGETVRVETFSIMVHEVSNRLYAHFAGASRIELPPDPCFPGIANNIAEQPDHPVVNISPSEAAEFASSMNLRLPTRNEWEYVASQGLTGVIANQYPWGGLPPTEAGGITGNYLAHDDWLQRDADGYAYTSPCGSFPLSRAGIADLGGNVAEMVHDDSVWVLKGGSWAQGEDAMTLGWSREFASGDRCWYAGFRLAR